MIFLSKRALERPVRHDKEELDKFDFKDMFALWVAYFQVFWPIMLIFVGILVIIYLLCR